jgi:predicted nucleotidyltransferase
MKSREEVLNVLRNARPHLQTRFPITRIALFGSYARGEQRADSDVDILVEVDPSIGLRFAALADELESLLKERVELVSSRAVSSRARPLIEADCIEVA